MATILLTWELGDGIGHLMRLRPIGQALVARGHRVVAAVRNLTRVRAHFGDVGIAFIAAPWIVSPAAVFSPIRSYAHILANIGFTDQTTLATLIEAWNTLFDFVRPDLVIADHSPTALLALHGRSIPRANIGLGFFCPPSGFPLPYWLKDHEKVHARQTIADERTVLGHVNAALALVRRAPLKNLGQIYRQVDETVLATYEEFDHFGPRTGARYWGHWPFFQGDVPQWPDSSGPKIFAYLKDVPVVEKLLGLLHRKGCPTLLLGVAPRWQSRFAAPHLRYVPRPLDLRLVARQCDLAIHHANHGTAVSLLLAGKPCLQFPLFTEQLLFAQKVQHLGAGNFVENANDLPQALDAVLDEGRFRQAAEVFARKYTKFDPGNQIPELVERLEALLKSSGHQVESSSTVESSSQ